MAHRFRRLSFRERGAAPAIWPHSRKQIRRNRDISRCSHLVCQILHPVRHSENLVNDQHHRPLVLRLRIRHERLDRPPVVLHRHPLAMPWRFRQLVFRPILRGSRLRHRQNQQNPKYPPHLFPLALLSIKSPANSVPHPFSSRNAPASYPLSLRNFNPRYRDQSPVSASLPGSMLAD